MIPLLLLYKIAQLFIVMVIGFLLVKMRVVKTADSVVLSRLSLYLLMPAAIINSFNVKLTGEILSGFALAVGAGILLHVMLLCVDAVFARVAKIHHVCGGIFYQLKNAFHLFISHGHVRTGNIFRTQWDNVTGTDRHGMIAEIGMLCQTAGTFGGFGRGAKVYNGAYIVLQQPGDFLIGQLIGHITANIAAATLPQPTCIQGCG
jgi:hypothetical protein